MGYISVNVTGHKSWRIW